MPTWAFINSTLLWLIIVTATAFPAKIRRWIRAGTSALSQASTTGFTTGWPGTPHTPTAMHYNIDNSKLSSTYYLLCKSIIASLGAHNFWVRGIYVDWRKEIKWFIASVPCVWKNSEI